MSDFSKFATRRNAGESRVRPPCICVSANPPIRKSICLECWSFRVWVPGDLPGTWEAVCPDCVAFELPEDLPDDVDEMDIVITVSAICTPDAQEAA